jgi:hypothetical protein
MDGIVMITKKYKTGNRAERDNVGAERLLPVGRDYNPSKNRGGRLKNTFLAVKRDDYETIKL